VGSADADVVEAAVDAEGEFGVGVDAVVADPVVAAAGGCAAGGGFRACLVGGGWGGVVWQGAVRPVAVVGVDEAVDEGLQLLTGAGLGGLSDQVRNGYQPIRVGFRLRGDEPEKLRSVVEQSRRRSAVFDVVTNGAPVSIHVDAD
jgi:hypothetical protein